MEYKDKLTTMLTVFGIALLLVACVLMVWAINESGIMHDFLPQRADTATPTPSPTETPQPTATFVPTPISVMGSPQDWSTRQRENAWGVGIFVFCVAFFLFVLVPWVKSKS